MKKSPLSNTAQNNDSGEIEVSSDRLSTWFPDLPEAQLGALKTFLAELVKFNKAVNLISASTVKNADSVHISDAVHASRLIIPKLLPNEPVYDFGSGNGIPGIVLGILAPQVKVVLVDRDSRKMEFCKHVIGLLELRNVSVLVQGVEDLPAGSVKNVVARGFAPFSKALITCRKLVPKGGRFFHMKSDGWANELASMPSQIFSHWSPNLLGRYRLPETTTDMAVVLTEKSSD